jgi:Acyl-protein synthetase, LuxE
MSTSLETDVLKFIAEPEEARFEDLALEVFNYQRRENPVYSKYCEYLGTGEKIDSWQAIPALPQAAFKRSAVRSFSASQTTTEFRTSGTTGEGHGKHFLPSLRLYEAAVQKGWDFFGLPRNHFVLFLQHPDDAPFSSLSCMGGILTEFERARFVIGKDGDLQLGRLMRALSEGQEPLTLFGTALAFLHLMERLPDLRIQLPPESIVMETGGFKGSRREISKRDLYDQMSREFGIGIDSIWNEYGMTELSSQFYCSGIDRSHHGPPWTRFQIIDAETNKAASPGKIGLVRIIDLANLWSVVGIQTEDLAIEQPEGGFLLLGRDPAALPRGCSRAIDELLEFARD